MERLNQRHQLLIKAIQSLKTVLTDIQELPSSHKYYAPLRDSTIQRFEYTVDTFWKFMREYVEKRFGIVTLASPKAVIKSLLDAELINQEKYVTLISMIDDRNLTSHAYNEEVAKDIFNAIPMYYEQLSQIIQQLPAKKFE